MHIRKAFDRWASIVNRGSPWRCRSACGTDAAGKTFSQNVTTVDVSQHGVKLTSVRASVNVDGSYDGSPCFVRDYVKTSYDISLKVNQYVFYLTYGITRHFEVSTAVPISNIRMSVVSKATIVPNSFAPQPPYALNRFNFFRPELAQTAPPPHITVPNCPAAPCFDAVFSDSRSVTGIADVIVRAKYQFYEGERVGLAGGLDARLPTGDEENFLGSGALGLKPFVVFSYRGRVSPHAEVGYELSGNSLLYGDYIATATNTKSALPSRFLYVAGATVEVPKRITAGFDLFGQRVFGASQLVPGQLADFGACNDSNCAAVTVGSPIPRSSLKSNAAINIVDASMAQKPACPGTCWRRGMYS